MNVPLTECRGHREGWRERLDPAKIADYRRKLREGYRPAAIRVDVIDGLYIIVDGHHRYEAARLEGHTHIVARHNHGVHKDQ